jgi:hypothetical protein
VFEFGREHYGLAVNPCRGIKRRPENNTRVRFLTETERKNLLTACKSSEWGSLYLLTLMAITTGARLGVKKVQISFSGNGCESCEKLDGKTMTIGKALKDMPLPRKNRTADVFGNEVPFCRCLYVSTD